MKKSLLITMCLMIIGVGVVVLSASSTSEKNETEVKSDSKTESVDAKINVSSDDRVSSRLEKEFASIPKKTASETVSSSGKVLYYFYQPECTNCLEIEEDIVNYYNEKPDSVEFYAVDLSIKDNSDIWNENVSSVGTKVEKISDFKVIGTPTIIQLSNGEIQAVAVGSDDVVKVLKDE